MSYQPLTWRNIQSNVAGTMQAANQGLDMANKNITNAFNGFNQVLDDQRKRESSRINSAFDMQLAGYTDAGELEAARSNILNQIKGYGTAVDPTVLTQAMDSRIKALHGQTSDAQQRELDGLRYTDSMAAYQRRPLEAQLDTLLANNDAKGAEAFMQENQEALGTAYSGYLGKLNTVKGGNTFRNLITGNSAAAMSDVYGLSEDEQAIYDQYNQDPSKVSDEDLATLDKAVARVGSLNTVEAHLQRTTDNIIANSANMTPEQVEMAIADAKAEAAAFMQRGAQATSDINTYKTALYKQNNMGENQFAKNDLAGGQGIDRSVSMGDVRKIIKGTNMDDSLDDSQVTMLADILTQISKRGMELQVGTDDNGKPIFETVPIPVDDEMIAYVASQYNNEWTSADATRAGVEAKLLSNYALADQYKAFNDVNDSVKQYTAAVDKRTGYDARNPAMVLANKLANIQSTRALNNIQASMTPPQDVPDKTAPTGSTIERLLNVAQNRRTNRGRGASESAQDYADDLVALEQKIAKRSGMDVDTLQNIRDVYRQTGEIDYPDDMGKITQRYLKRRLDELIQEENVARFKFLR